MIVRACVLSLAIALPAFADDALWEVVRSEPNIVVFIRHTQSSGGKPLRWDESGQCEGESMLTPEAREHARRIGEAFASRGIKPVVISSPMCRCRDTATIAFGSPPVMDPALREVASADGERLQAYEKKARELIATRRGAVPIVFVNHIPNIDRFTMELVENGELIVGRATASGDVEVLGRMRVP